MSHQHLIVEPRGGVLWVTMNRPERLNALNPGLVQELRETKASSFTLRDTPMFTCRRRTLAECLDALG